MRSSYLLRPGLPRAIQTSYFYWAFAERAQGNISKESELLQKVVKLQPGNVKAHMMLASSLLEQDRTAEGIAELRIVLAISPNSAEADSISFRALFGPRIPKNRRGCLTSSSSSRRITPSSIRRSRSLIKLSTHLRCGELARVNPSL